MDSDQKAALAEMRPDCEECWEPLDLRMKHLQDMDGQWVHLKCAPSYFPYQCVNPDCGYWWGEDSEDGCGECGGKVVKRTAEEVIKAFKGMTRKVDL